MLLFISAAAAAAVDGLLRRELLEAATLLGVSGTLKGGVPAVSGVCGLEDGALLEPVSSDLLAARPGAVFAGRVARGSAHAITDAVGVCHGLGSRREPLRAPWSTLRRRGRVVVGARRALARDWLRRRDARERRRGNLQPAFERRPDERRVLGGIGAPIEPAAARPVIAPIGRVVIPKLSMLCYACCVGDSGVGRRGRRRQHRLQSQSVKSAGFLRSTSINSA